MGLLGKSWQVWRASKKAEKANPHISRKGDELEFLPAAVEVLETPASPAGRLLTILIAVMFTTAIIWSWFGEIDTVAVAQGKIIPGGRVKVIQPLEAGVVRAIQVEEGQRVAEGQVLIELDPTETGADEDRLSLDLMVAKLDQARLTALIVNPGNPAAAFAVDKDAGSVMREAARGLMLAQADEYRQSISTLEAEIRQQQAELGAAEARIAKFRDTAPLLRKRVEAWAYLAKKEYASRLRLTELQEQLVGRERDITIEERQISVVRESIGVLRRRIFERRASFASRNNTDLADAVRRVNGLENEVIKAKDRLSRRVLRAPVAGTVQQLAIHTVGGVVQPAQQLMVLVPEGSKLEVEAMVLNKDIGFVQATQDAAIKIESFPFTKFGLIPGRVQQISADSVLDEKLGLIFPARIEMLKSRILVGSRWVALAPGMAVTVEVKTGKRRAIEFFLSPLMEYQDEALRER
jgi:hemolysin D